MVDLRMTKWSVVRFVLTHCLLVYLLMFAGSISTASKPVIVVQNVARVPEGVLRKAAKTVVRPEYPLTSKKRQGLAVVSVDVNEYGYVTDVTLVEAPDEEIGRSVISAVKQWRFGQLTTEGHAIRLRGKLSFYFVIRDGKARVTDPKSFGAASPRR